MEADPMSKRWYLTTNLEKMFLHPYKLKLLILHPHK